MRGIDCHTIAMLVVAFRSTASAVEQEAPVREGVVGETVGFPTLHVRMVNRIYSSLNISLSKLWVHDSNYTIKRILRWMYLI